MFEYTDKFPGYYNFLTKSITEVVLALFLFIGGFLAGKSSIKSTKISDFYIKRLVRIYPLYLIAIFLFYLFKIDKDLTLIKSLAGISMIYPPAPLTLWFICLILLFYLATPFLTKLAKKINFIKYCFSLIFIITLLLTFYYTTRALDERLVMYLPTYSLGLYCAVNNVKNTFFRTKILVIISIFIFFIYSTLIVKNTTIEISDVYTIFHHPFISSLIKAPFLLICSYFIFMTSYKNQDTFVYIKSIEIISYSSYAMYLFHRPIFEILTFLYFPDNGNLQILYLMTFCIIIIIIISWFIQKVYDIFCNLLKRKVII